MGVKMQKDSNKIFKYFKYHKLTFFILRLNNKQ